MRLISFRGLEINFYFSKVINSFCFGKVITGILHEKYRWGKIRKILSLYDSKESKFRKKNEKKKSPFFKTNLQLKKKSNVFDQGPSQHFFYVFRTYPGIRTYITLKFQIWCLGPKKVAGCHNIPMVRSDFDRLFFEKKSSSPGD